MYAKGVAGGNSRLGYYILMKPTFVAERWFFCVIVKADYAKKNILYFLLIQMKRFFNEGILFV